MGLYEPLREGFERNVPLAPVNYEWLAISLIVNRVDASVLYVTSLAGLCVGHLGMIRAEGLFNNLQRLVG